MPWVSDTVTGTFLKHGKATSAVASHFNGVVPARLSAGPRPADRSDPAGGVARSKVCPSRAVATLMLREGALRACGEPGGALSLQTSDENQGLGGKSRNEFRTSDRSRVVSRGPQRASCGVVFDRVLAAEVNSTAFWAGALATGAGRRVVEEPSGRLGFWWARVEDESKSRRQGLVVCRVTLPYEGFCDARPGVTLAPIFLGAAACQSRTTCA